MEEKVLDGVRFSLDERCIDKERKVLVLGEKDLENWIEHFSKLGRSFMENGCPTWQSWFYWGKREVLVDMYNLIFKRYGQKEV